MHDEVDYVSGRTRLYGIVGHPIEQVRSPEMITAEMKGRGRDAVLVPMHVFPDDFETLLPQLMRMRNIDGLVFTIPYKARAVALADELGDQAQIVGAINALRRAANGTWHGDIFDGIGCVEAFRRRGIPLAGRNVMLMGAGGAGSAIAVAVGFEKPRTLTIFDVDPSRADALARRVSDASPGVRAIAGPATIEGMDVLMNATPIGMLNDARLPLAVDALPKALVVFDAIVKPERTPLIDLAQHAGCTTVLGREMMRGQIARMVDFFFA